MALIVKLSTYMNVNRHQQNPLKASRPHQSYHRRTDGSCSKGQGLSCQDEDPGTSKERVIDMAMKTHCFRVVTKS